MAQNTIETKDDYTGSGGGGIEIIETDDQLDAFLATQDNDDLDDDETGAIASADPGQGGNNDGAGASSTDDDNTGGGDDTGTGTDDDLDDADAGQSQTAAPEAKNVVEYINERFEMNMNVDSLPEDMSVEDQYQTVGDLFERVRNGAIQRLKAYEHIEEILKDEEVAGFIKAKSENKTLRDYVLDYASTTEGMNDEQLILEELKVTMPGSSEEERRSVLEGFRTANTVETTAANLRKARTAREEQAAEAARIAEENKQKADEQAYLQEVQQFKGYLTGINDVFGVPFTDEMRNQVFDIATKVDANGLTAFDRAVQSDEGLLLATLGLAHLQNLMQANATTKVNKKNKKFVDKLFDTPDQLQSRGGSGDDGRISEQDELDLINRM